MLFLIVIVNSQEDYSWNVSRNARPRNRSGKELWFSTEATASLVRLILSLKTDILINDLPLRESYIPFLFVFLTIKA